MNVNVFAESMEMGEEHSAVLLESRSENSPLEVKFEAADIPDETLNQSLDLYLLAGKNGVSRNAFDGMIKVVNTRKVYKSFLMFAGGDLPATIKMAGLSGHSHTCSCKICVARRRTVERKHVVNGHGYPLCSKQSFGVAHQQASTTLLPPCKSLSSCRINPPKTSMLSS